MRIVAWIVGLGLMASVVSAQHGGQFCTGMPNKPVQSYYQPILLQTPEGTDLAGVSAGQFSERLPSPFQGGLLIGKDYRFRITGIPYHPGKELFPTVMLLARTYPPQGRELDFPVLISLTFEDLELALEGRYITRVIYLEDPKRALPVQSTDGQITHDIRSGEPVSIAATQGLPVAIVRIGGRMPHSTESNLSPEFCFGSPPWILNRTVRPDKVTVVRKTLQQNSTLAIDPALKSAGLTVLEQHQTQQQNPLGRRANEYLINGNDADKPAYVDGWTTYNFGAGDTIAHFDTLNGKVVVEPSNDVKIYSPRFGAIRKVEGLLQEGQVTGLIETRNQQISNQNKNTIQTGFTAQESQTLYARTKDQISNIEGQRRGTGMESAWALGGYGNFQTVDSENMTLFQRTFGFEGSARTQLEHGAANAKAWMGSENVKIQINELAPMTATGIDGAAAYFQVDDKQSKTSKLRLIKIASKDSAAPGETIDFTLRFDNVGTELIGNVTILDDLTGRLEFLSGTAIASLKSGFASQVNQSGSLTLRFEITEPLAPGDFGVIQFQCRVR